MLDPLHAAWLLGIGTQHWAVPREVDTGFHAAMGISVALWSALFGVRWCRIS
jgi:hypothetical protein